MKKKIAEKMIGALYGIRDELTEIRLELEGLRDELHEAGLEIHEASRGTAEALDSVCDCIAGRHSREYVNHLRPLRPEA